MSKFFTVATTGSEREVNAYLYGHTTVVRTVVDTQRGRRHVLLKTTDSLHGSDTSETYLAQSQAARFASGLHGVSPVFDTEADAVDKHFATWGISLGDPSVEAVKTISQLRVEAVEKAGEHLDKAIASRAKHPEKLALRLGEADTSRRCGDAESLYFRLIAAVTACGWPETTTHLVHALHVLLGFFEVESEADNARRRQEVRV